jgi:hypothetical protein
MSTSRENAGHASAVRAVAASGQPHLVERGTDARPAF